MRELAEAGVPFTEAQAIYASEAIAERAREQRLEFAELMGLELTRDVSREARMRRWNALDLMGDE